MIRIIGAGLIGIVCAYAGFRAAEKLKRRKAFFTEFILSLGIVETEIVFGQKSLIRIFKELKEREYVGDFYGEVCESLMQKGIKAAWREGVKNGIENVSLKDDEESILLSLGSELGMSDIEGQKRAINRTVVLLKNVENKAAEEYMRLAKAYKWCGVLAGVFVMIAAV